jgi:hypothetical protein
MLVYKCELCKKEIDRQEPFVTLGYKSSIGHQSFCAACGKPLLNFLKRHKLIEKE